MVNKTSPESFVSAHPWKCEIPYMSNPVEQHRVIVEDMVKAILHKAKLLAPMEEGIRSLELGNAILLSGLKDKTISLPIDSAEYEKVLKKLIATSRYHRKEGK